MKIVVKQNKTLRKLILASLLISSLPTPLPARAAQAPATISKWEIDQKIIGIKKTTKKLRRIQKIVPLATVGTGAAITIALIVASIGILFFIIMAPVPVVKGSTQATRFAGKLLLGTMIATLISGFTTGSAAILSHPVTSVIFGNLSARALLSATIEANKLEKIESSYPNTLTTEQKKILTQFKKTIKGPIIKGIIKGIGLKQALRTTINKTLRQNPRLFAQLGGIKKAQKIIANYLKLSWQKRNLQRALDTYNDEQEKFKIARDKHKKGTFAYHLANTKLTMFKLKPSYVVLKLQIKKLKRKIKNLQNKYGATLEKRSIINAMQNFMQKADTIVLELKKPA